VACQVPCHPNLSVQRKIADGISHHTATIATRWSSNSFAGTTFASSRSKGEFVSCSSSQSRNVAPRELRAPDQRSYISGKCNHSNANSAKRHFLGPSTAPYPKPSRPLRY
jgi:hypothetical protein